VREFQRADASGMAASIIAETVELSGWMVPNCRKEQMI
jgi:hypothetical protein